MWPLALRHPRWCVTCAGNIICARSSRSGAAGARSQRRPLITRSQIIRFCEIFLYLLGRELPRALGVRLCARNLIYFNKDGATPDLCAAACVSEGLTRHDKSIERRPNNAAISRTPSSLVEDQQTDSHYFKRVLPFVLLTQRARKFKMKNFF